MDDNGALGLPFDEMNEVEQAAAMGLVDRGFDVEDVTAKMLSFSGTRGEGLWWERWMGPAIDNLAYALGYASAWKDD